MVISGVSSIAYLLLAVAVFAGIEPPFFGLIVAYGILQNASLVIKFSSARGYGRNVDFAISGVLATLIMATMNVVWSGSITASGSICVDDRGLRR